MYERKLQETRARKESLRFKNVADFYLILLIIVIIVIFFANDVFGLSRLIFGVKGVIIKGMDYNRFMSSYGLKNGYLKNFTIFDLGNFISENKPNFVKNVRLRYIFFDKFEISFKLKEKIAIIHENEHYYFVDNDGKAWGSPTPEDLKDNLIIFNLDSNFSVKDILFLKKYANIISEIDYADKIIYFKRGKILKFGSWQDLEFNKQIITYIYEILGASRELFLIKNKIMIK
jgi:cell division septal protein FtsQ